MIKKGMMIFDITTPPNGTPSETEGELSRIGTMCRSRKKRADASLGIGDDNTFARKGFFSEIHIVENKHAKLK